jgi:hypothetical protein
MAVSNYRPAERALRLIVVLALETILVTSAVEFVHGCHLRLPLLPTPFVDLD